MIDRPSLVNYVRGPVFGGAISLAQMSGITIVLDEWERRHLEDKRWLADMLGTTVWETNKSMQPVREAYYLNTPVMWAAPSGPAEAYRRTLRYYPFYGRGYVQLTWEDNYRKMTRLLRDRFGIDFVQEPDAVMRPDIACAIMFEGMLRADSHFGDFTGVALEDYFNDHTEDWVGARRIINSLDHADEIADISKLWYAGLGGPSYRRMLKLGDKGTDVQLVQDTLNKLGFSCGKPDGDFGQNTRLAIISFQRSKKLGVDGQVGPQTYEALNIQH